VTKPVEGGDSIFFPGHIKGARLEVGYFDKARTKKKYSGHYLDDKKHGVWIYYYESGDLHEIVTYKDGLKDGDYENYQWGRKNHEGSYTKDNRDGYWIWYTWDKNGKEIVLESGKYKNGKKCGTWERYYPLLKKYKSTEHGSC